MPTGPISLRELLEYMDNKTSKLDYVYLCELLVLYRQAAHGEWD